MEGRVGELTPREREVLELVRAGLTNDQIAERLAITSDGVKYHVSQVLSKLGVSSRHEAVAAAYGEKRRPWWASAFASTALRIAAGVGAVVVVVFVLVLMFGVLKSGDSGDAPDVSGLTLQSVVGSVQRAVTRPGEVLHTQIKGERTYQGETVPYYTTELWVDASRETVRSEYRLAPESYHYDAATESTSIIAGNYSYIEDSPGKAYRYAAETAGDGSTVCLGVSVIWMGVLFSCGSAVVPRPTDPPRLEAGEFRGTSAIVIAYGDAELPSIDPDAAHPTVPLIAPSPPPFGVATGTPGVTATFRYSWRIYLDGGSYLPIAYTYAQVDDQGFGLEVDAAYENEFVPLDQDIETLLDPHSIGYGAENGDALLDEIANQVTVYWLGKEFPGASGLDELVLAGVLVGEQQGGVQQVYSVAGQLVYQAPDGYPEVRLYLWRKTVWDAFLQTMEARTITDPQCALSVQLEVSGATATAYLFSPLQFPDLGQTPIAVPIGATPPVFAEPTGPAPGESRCNFARRSTALVDTIIGVVQFGDVVIEIRQDGETTTTAQMESLMQQLRPR